MDQSAACDRRHRLDGGHAVSTATVRLSLRSESRIRPIRNFQGHGTTVAEGDHQPCDDRDLAVRTLPRLGRTLFFCGLAAWQAAAGVAAVRSPRIFFSLGEGFRRRPQYPQSKILSYYQ